MKKIAPVTSWVKLADSNLRGAQKLIDQWLCGWGRHNSSTSWGRLNIAIDNDEVRLRRAIDNILADQTIYEYHLTFAISWRDAEVGMCIWELPFIPPSENPYVCIPRYCFKPEEIMMDSFHGALIPNIEFERIQVKTRSGETKTAWKRIA